MNRKVTVYQTHIEVFPYEKGSNFSIEDFYSLWDPVYFRQIPIAYHVEDHTLYLPRGTSISYLERIFNTPAYVNTSHDKIKSIKIKNIIESNKKIQKEAVEFLCSKNEFIHGMPYSQLALNLEPGDGKTIATILSICKRFKCKTIVIVHTTKLKYHWRQEFHKATNIDDDEIIDIVGSEMMEKVANGEITGSIYLVNHQSIHGYGSLKGWNAVREFFANTGIGLKIFDEAHKYFSNIMMIDFFSNTRMTIYLSATFTRVDTKERIMFKRAFSNCLRFGEKEINTEKRKHVNYLYITYDSMPDPSIIPSMYNKYSISAFKYIDYALSEDNNTMLKVLKITLKQIECLEGKIIITSPKIESSSIIANYISKLYPDKKVAVVNSSEDKDANEEAILHADIISSTIKSLGTGIDIKGLRVLINLEPFTSESNLIQLKGRLREYSPTEDTYMIDIVDVGFKDISRMGQTRFKYMKKLAKQIKEVML